VVQRAGVNRDSRATAPRAAQRDGLAELVGGGEQQVLVQAAEQHPVRVDHVDEAGQAEPEGNDEAGDGRPHPRAGRVPGAEHGDGLVKHRGVLRRDKARGRHEALGVGLHVEAAPVAAGAQAAVRVDADVAGLHGQAAASRVERAAQHQSAADAAVLSGDDQQVLSAAARAVPVLRQRDRVDVVDRHARHGARGAHAAAADAMLGQLVGQQPAEHVPDLGAGRPAEVERADRGAFGVRDGARDRERRADAGPAGSRQQPGAGRRERRQGPRGIVRGRDLAAGPGHDPAAELDQGDREAVGVQLRREGNRPAGVDRQAVRRAALGAAPGSGVDVDQAQVAKLAGERAGRGPGDAQRGGQRGPGGRLPGVDQRERGARQADPVMPGLCCPGAGGPGLLPAVRRARHR
jgi:hypothetical protein